MSSHSPKHPGPRGYLKVTLSIITKDSQTTLPLANPNINDEIEGNLLLPDGLTLERQRAKFVFKIYKGEDITKKKIIVLDNLKTQSQKFSTQSTLVQVTFAGIMASTSVKKHTQSPIWNEQLIVAELFPPLCQRIKIQLKSKGSNLKAVKYLHLHSIANDQENGFLPTFGPAYVHFYKKDRFGDVYVGKVLMGLHTHLQHDYLTKPRSFIKKNIAPFNESSLWKSEPVLLFCAIISVQTIDKRFSKKRIRFEISIGPTKQPVDISQNTAPNITDEMTPVTNDNNYWYVDFKGQIPCISYQNHFPDLRRRFYNKNMITKISEEFKRCLDELDPLFHYERNRIPSGLIERKLIDALTTLATQCRRYIEIATFSMEQQVTDLDKEKAKLCLREMADIEKLAKTIYSSRTKKKSYRKAQEIYARIALLEDHPQDCWPDILIYMIYNGKKIATRMVEAEDVIYSKVEEEIGQLCGKIHTISFDTPLKLKTTKHGKAACTMDLFLWIGVKKHMEYCFSAMPDTFRYPEQATGSSVPRYLVLADKHIFQCRAHIYQGKFNFAADVTGVSDFFIRVILNEESACTEVVISYLVIEGKLNPLWDQTVIIPKITLYGSSDYIKEHPPTCIIEVLDEDDRSHSQYVGRVLIKPAVKLRSEPYTKPNFPPVLKWYKIIQKSLVVGKVLLCVELLEITSIDHTIPRKSEVLRIPEDIRPLLSGYKVDIMFWGVRQLKKLRGMPITRPNIVIDFTVKVTESETVTSKFPNFEPKLQNLLIRLPIDQDYIPSLSFQLNDNRNFGRSTYIANRLTNIHRFMYYPMTTEERQFLLSNPQTKSIDSMHSSQDVAKEEKLVPKIPTFSEEFKKEFLNEAKERFEEAKGKLQVAISTIKKQSRADGICCRFRRKKKKQESEQDNTKEKTSTAIIQMDLEQDDDSFTDWWTKYFLSLEKTNESTKVLSEASVPTASNRNFRLKIYSDELEYQPEFNGFQDTLMTFPLIRGERAEDEAVESKHIMGIFKGNLKIYPWPPNKDLEYVSITGKNLKNGYFQDSPSNDTVSFIARVYCIRGITLRPNDISGQSDPFLVAFMGGQYFSTSKEYIPRQINPIFGKCFEFIGMFPNDTIVTLQVWDYDKHSRHDIIGETRIDLENRFYSRHRAQCGIAYEYQERGPSVWRDAEPPTEILKNLCEFYNLQNPRYYDTYIMIGPLIFAKTVLEGEVAKASYTKEELALDLLHKWHEMPVVGCHLVPEHVETRSIYKPHQPGLEQGKLQLWVDIFRTSDLPPPAPIDVTPRKPQIYELRVVILNTEEVLLHEDDFFAGEKKSDIYIKGWLMGVDDIQCTDVHYRSLNGEGNFNWRFVFPFTYLKTEDKIVIKKAEMFHMVQSERKTPCKLKLQIWDNDTFSPDDFLGSLTMDLSRMPRGANSPRLCNLQLLESTAPRINLFKLKRTKGWWPFQGIDQKTNEYILAGKLEAELHIVTGDEAAADPVGKGRNEPHALPQPKMSKMSMPREAYSSTLSHIPSLQSQVANTF